MNVICGDNRFELIKKYKLKLIEATNINTSEDELKVLDNILFRFWQMGWLDTLEEGEQKSFEWCDGCKEYDQEQHCCHRWTKVIRETVDDLKMNQWIPVSERLPEEGTEVLGTDRNGCIRHVYKDKSGLYEFATVEEGMHLGVVAWMPLPDSYKEDKT